MNKIKNFCLGAILSTVAATALAADVISFANFERDGVPVLIPEVQKYEAAQGAFRLPDTLTVAVPPGEALIAEQLAADLKRFGKAAEISADAVCRFEVIDRGVPEHGEGYVLRIDASGISVKSRTADGLFRGAQTLRNLLRNAAAPELKACVITDRPDFELRSYTFNLREIPPKDLSLVKKAIDTLAQLKINTVFVSIEEGFPYRDNPFVKAKNPYTAEQVRDFAEFCRRRHIRVIPTVQVYSHAYWMTFHPDWDKMKEGKPKIPWYSTPCPQNEEARELTAKVLNEQIDMFDPTHFYVCLDEIYFGPRGECPRCKGKDQKKLLADYLHFIENILDKRGVKMIVCQDSFVDNGMWKLGHWFRTQLRPETFIRWWNYNDVLPEAEFKLFKDFEVMGNAVCGKPLNVYNMTHLLKKYGKRACNLTYWYYSDCGVFAKLKNETPESRGGVVIGADYLWKFRDTFYGNLGYDAAFEMMRLTHPNQVKAHPGMGEATPLPLDASFNAELSATGGKFPRFDSDGQTEELKRALRALPEHFEFVTSLGGKYYAVRLTGDKQNGGRHAVMIPAGERKMKELSFLLSCSRSYDEMAYIGARFYGIKRWTYPAVGAIDLCYADGTSVRTMLKYRESVTDWNRAFSGNNIRFAVRGIDASNRFYTFGIFDLVNPHPEKPVKSIMFSSTKRDGVSLALFAVSARGIDKPFPTAKTFAPEQLSKRLGVTDGVEARPTIIADFGNGMGPVRVDVTGSMKDVIEIGIIDDPTAPTPGKVLRIYIPAGEYTGHQAAGRFLRVDVTIPQLEVPPQSGARTADIFLALSGGKGFSHAQDYLTLVRPGKPNLFRNRILYGTFGYALLEGKWQRMTMPFWMVKKHAGSQWLKDPYQANRRTISFFFRKIDAPVEIRIDNIGFAPKGFSSAPWWKPGEEGDPL